MKSKIVSYILSFYSDNETKVIGTGYDDIQNLWGTGNNMRWCNNASNNNLCLQSVQCKKMIEKNVIQFNNQWSSECNIRDFLFFSGTILHMMVENEGERNSVY